MSPRELRSASIYTLPGLGEPRTLLHTHLVLDDSELHFYVTHLAAWGRWGRTARSVQIGGLVEQLKQSNGPFVLVGDLNAPPNAPEIGTLMAAELFRMCGDDVTLPTASCGSASITSSPTQAGRPRRTR